MVSIWVLAIASNPSCRVILGLANQRRLIAAGLALAVTLGTWSTEAFAIDYLSRQDFLSQAFVAQPAAHKLWMDSELQSAASEILGHPYPSLRVRYWQLDNSSAWILEEIGKEMPITIGVKIENAAVAEVKILSYRESRGSEVRHSFFTDQFKGLKLRTDDKLDKRIDGISGATLSVRAVKNVSRFALFLDSYVTSHAVAEH